MSVGRAKWGSDALRVLKNSPTPEICRVCDQEIPAFADRWGRPWTNVGVGHAECGWFRPDDLDVKPWLGELQIAATGQAKMTRSSLNPLHVLGLVWIRGGEFGVTPIGLLLVKRVQDTVSCSCGRVFVWSDVPSIGVQDFDDGMGGVERLDLRNCPRCGSTRSRALKAVAHRSQDTAAQGGPSPRPSSARPDSGASDAFAGARAFEDPATALNADHGWAGDQRDDYARDAERTRREESDR